MKQTAAKTCMRKLCPSLDKDDGLETILEIPIPEEMFTSMGTNLELRWQTMLTWMKAQTAEKLAFPPIAARFNELRFQLYLVGSPLLPLQVQVGDSIHRRVRYSSIEASTANYIVQQYIAATGGQPALSAVQSMNITGQVKISASDFHQTSNENVCCGSNGKTSWRHSSNQETPTSRGPPRPLRRFLQGFDPRAAANLFLDAACIGEKIINDEDCFILKLETSPAMREAQSGPNFEIIHHTLWGYFSQRSGLLVQFEDSRLISMTTKNKEDVFWETSTESVMEDYRYVDGVNVAH
ncbi:hypothetical protein L6164_027729 [Bauhinia variegata]|uniref:Uncharacterized protein n=1 Tax=Bauhinia variegata TaxID=167791 RepID=A0ACB9LU97_BAUVA|nr:hypothetical protein L6164_027729 [Bauhinia variegata]